MKRLVLLVLSIFMVSQVSFASFRAYVTQPAPTNALIAHELIHNPGNPPNDADEIVQTLGDKAFRNWITAIVSDLVFTGLALVTGSKFLLFISLLISVPATIYATLWTTLTISKFIHSNSSNYKAITKATLIPIALYSLLLIIYYMSLIAGA